jgi:hypothetical protein
MFDLRKGTWFWLLDVMKKKVLKVMKNGFRNRNRISNFGLTKDKVGVQDGGVSC